MATKRIGNINVNYALPESQTQMYNALGRTAGAEAANPTGNNFFAKRWNSIENALGTTGSAAYSLGKDAWENLSTDTMRAGFKDSLNDIYRKYGFQGRNDYIDQLDAAEQSGNQAEVDRLKNITGLNEELKAQADANAAQATAKANAYNDYRDNNYVSKKINQDRGKFAGSAINTLSTGLDVTGLTSTPGLNAIQGGVEGVADELEQNGLENFDWGRAGQNAAIGAATGLATGLVNKGLNKFVNPKTGNLINLGSKTGLGRLGSTVATGAARGAISGAVGGATGAGLSAAMNNGDIVGSALQGAGQGFVQGAKTGAIMSGVNAGLSKTPFMKQINEAKQNWENSGKNFDERLTNTLNSGDSAVGNWLNRDTSSKLLNTAGNVGLSIKDYTDQGMGPRKAEQEAYKEYMTAFDDEESLDNLIASAEAAGVPGDSNFRKAQRLVEGGLFGVYYDDAFNGLKEIYGDDFNPDIYLNKDGSYKYKDGEPYVWTIYKNKLAMALSREMDARDVAQNSPQTTGEWAKRAGERVVEDLNNKGAGLSVQDTSGQMPEDIRNMQVRDYNNDYNSDANGSAVNGYGETQAEVANNLAIIKKSIADGNVSYDEIAYLNNHQNAVLQDGDIELAQWAGISEDTYQNFPTKEMREGTATAETTTTQPQQLSAWDRLAQENGYQDWNSVEQSFKAANPNYRATGNDAGAITTWLDNNQGDWNPNYEVKNPQTELYNQLTGNKTSARSELRRAAGLKLQEQYGTIDKPTAKATNAPETLQKIAEAGFTKPGDVERMAGVITGSNGEVSKLVSNLVATADPINTFDGETSGQTLSDYIDLSIQKNGLDGIREGKAVKSQIDAIMKSLPSHADGSVTFVDNPQDVFKLTQLLDSEAANYEGRSGMNYGTTTPDKLRAAKVIKDVSSLLKDRIYDSVDVKAALTPEVAQNLKAYAPNNQAWSDYIDNEVMAAKNVKDLRSVQAPWVRANKIIDNGYMNSMTYGGRNGGAGNFPLTPRGIKSAVLNATINSKPGLRAQAKVLNKVADWVPDTPKATTTTGSTGDVAVATPIAGTGYNPATQIYNAIGRTQGEISGNQNQQRDDTLGMSAESGYVAPLGASTYTSADGTLESLVSPTTSASSSVYDALYGTQTPTVAKPKYFDSTGDYWTDIIATAMSSAIDDNDVTAFATLYQMYQNALAGLQGNSSSSSSQKLTATQQRANAAMNSLERLAQMTPDLGYNLSNIPVIGNIATFGGNNYEAEAKSLAQQIGYMVSGSNIKESEAENIGKSYVPQPWDNDQTRINKLRRASAIIQQYQNGYATE